MTTTHHPAERWLLRIPTFKDTSFRVAMLEYDIRVLDIAILAHSLDHIAELAEQTDERAREVLAAAAPTLTDPATKDRLDQLREIAKVDGLLALGRLIRSKQKLFEEPPDDPSKRPTALTQATRPLTLGERKSLARRQDRTTLDRLLRDPHPAVIRNVLKNPRIVEADVMRLAAKRPTYPDIQVEIAKSERWSTSGRVRVALAENPFTPIAVAIPLLPLLLRHELEQLVHATNLLPIVRASAMELLERRPPVAEAEDAIEQ